MPRPCALLWHEQQGSRMRVEWVFDGFTKGFPTARAGEAHMELDADKAVGSVVEE